MVLTILLPDDLRLGPSWLLPVIEGVLLVALIVGDPGRIDRRSAALRALSVGLVAVLVLSALWATVMLIDDLINGGAETNSASELLEAGATVWVSNIIAFALLYWELDGGGAAARAHRRPAASDFAFPQQLNPEPRAGRTGGPASSTTSIWVSPTRPRSARPTRCRSRPGRRSRWRCRRSISLGDPRPRDRPRRERLLLAMPRVHVTGPIPAAIEAALRADFELVPEPAGADGILVLAHDHRRRRLPRTRRAAG